jgi:hypothetical protein
LKKFLATLNAKSFILKAKGLNSLAEINALKLSLFLYIYIKPKDDIFNKIYIYIYILAVSDWMFNVESRSFIC